MQEDHSIDTLLKRLDSISGELEELRQEIRMTVQLAGIDPRMTLTRTRRVLEYLVNDIFRRHFEEDPGTRPLDNLLDRVIKEHVLPPRVAAYAQGIRWLGNMGTHGKGEEVLQTDAEQSLKQLVEILLWYFEQERPDALTGQAGPDGGSPEPNVDLNVQTSPEIGAIAQGAPSAVASFVLKKDDREEGALPASLVTRLKRYVSTLSGRIAAIAVGAALIVGLATWFATKPDPEQLEQAYNRGLMYQRGTGVPKDYAQALKAFRVAANGGLPKAQYALGVMYQQGWGVGKDPATAAKWYKLAADQNYALAQNDLGVLYHDGQGVMQDATVAMRWYRKAADQGLAMAQRNLGMMYLSGVGTPRDYAQALVWLQKAAEHGYADAQFHLGLMYLYGEGIPKNPGEAFRFENAAAKTGYGPAENALGYLYENGIGVEKDVNAALSWYQASANTGLELGKQNFARLTAALASARQQAELQQQQRATAASAASAASQERRMRRERQANQQAFTRYQEAERQRQAAEQAAIARQQEMARQRQAADAARQQQNNNLLNNLLRGIIQPRP